MVQRTLLIPSVLSTSTVACSQAEPDEQDSLAAWTATWADHDAEYAGAALQEQYADDWASETWPNDGAKVYGG